MQFIFLPMQLPCQRDLPRTQTSTSATGLLVGASTWTLTQPGESWQSTRTPNWPLNRSRIARAVLITLPAAPQLRMSTPLTSAMTLSLCWMLRNFWVRKIHLNSGEYYDLAFRMNRIIIGLYLGPLLSMGPLPSWGPLLSMGPLPSIGFSSLHELTVDQLLQLLHCLSQLLTSYRWCSPHQWCKRADNHCKCKEELHYLLEIKVVSWNQFLLELLSKVLELHEVTDVQLIFGTAFYREQLSPYWHV